MAKSRITGDSTLSRLVVQVDMVVGREASVRDQFGRYLQVRTHMRRGNGPAPREGETWILDTTLGGGWSFAACLDSKPPTVTGSTDQNPALISLLAALAEAGYIVNETTNTQLRATHPHTHPHTHTVPSGTSGSGGDPTHSHSTPGSTTSTNAATDSNG